MLSSTHSQALFDIVFEVTNCDARHADNPKKIWEKYNQ